MTRTINEFLKKHELEMIESANARKAIEDKFFKKFEATNIFDIIKPLANQFKPPKGMSYIEPQSFSSAVTIINVIFNECSDVIHQSTQRQSQANT